MAIGISPSLVRPLGRGLREMAEILILLACLWGVTLQSNTEAPIRLVGSSSNCSGRVEVFHDGQWGTVCHDDWGMEEATVVCRQVGCGGATGALFGSGTGPIWLAGLRCRGNESALSQCPARPWGVNDCNHQADAGVVCSGPNLESDYAIEMRLENSSSNCSGRVEVFHKGQWGTICDDFWDIKEARVVCRQMGCGEARAAMGGAHFGRGTGPVWLGFAVCTGNESTLHQCHAVRWGPNKCRSEGGAGVVCSGAKLESDDTFDIRLVNGPSNCSGRVEVFHNGLWGTICDDRWGIQEATVVCQQMGCGEARAAPHAAHFGRGSGPIWLYDVHCTGSESTLSLCPANPWGEHPCSHREDAAVLCSGETSKSDTAIAIRIVNGPSNCSGRVEVFYAGQWGTVCDDHWDIKEATVVCQQMGCGEARSATTGAGFGRGIDPIWLDEVHCTGTESALSQCPAHPWGTSNCGHGEDAGVICSGGTLESDPAIEIRLVNGPSNCSGRVEVFHAGQWGTICDDNWDIKEATVVCQQMGCEAASAAPGGARFGSGAGHIWLDDMECEGTESALSQCPARPWGAQNCHHGEDAGVVCSGNQLSSSRWSLWVPALSVLLATALLAVGGITWYLRSKWKGSRGYEVSLETMHAEM